MTNKFIHSNNNVTVKDLEILKTMKKKIRGWRRQGQAKMKEQRSAKCLTCSNKIIKSKSNQM